MPYRRHPLEVTIVAWSRTWTTFHGPLARNRAADRSGGLPPGRLVQPRARLRAEDTAATPASEAWLGG